MTEPVNASPGPILKMKIAECMELLLTSKSRILGLHGGRGGMKSWLFVDMLLFKMVLNPNLSAVCLREVQGALDQSVKRLIDLRIKAHQLEDYFESTKSEIRSKRGSGIVVFKGLSKLTEAGIKSMESFDIWFIEEGQTISKASLAILMPTVRKVGSQVWIAWNPLDETVPVDELLRGKNRRQDATVIEVNFW